MPFIAFDLDALNVARDVANAAAITEERVTHGLLRMWAWCFREGTEYVDDVQVRGFFGPEAVPALTSFGFLEATKGRLRVRGAERYLRITEHQQKAGKVRASSAGRSAGRFTSRAPAGDQPPPAGHQPATSPAPALTPSTEHRTPKEGAHGEVVKRLVAACAGYAFTSRDAKAVKEMLDLGTADEIETRWRRALAHKGFPSVRAIHELLGHWNHFGSGPTTQRVSIEDKPSRML